MSPFLRILSAPPGSSVQDAGRTGWLRHGVSPAGPMDWIAHAVANRLAGNPAGAGALEVGPGGIALEALGGVLRLGLAADGFRVERDGRALAPRGAVTLAPGQVLALRPGESHVWAYVAVAGGLALAPVMGSLSTHLRSGLGPAGALAAGMTLPARATAAPAPDLAAPPAPAPAPVLRVIPGPQDDAFIPAARALFAGGAAFTVSARSDRMGYRLEGPRLEHASGHDIVSDGIALGSVQVPGDGMPIVLMADRQPTGGYPKIATVIRADLPALAQSRPGREIRFRAVALAEAVAALAAARAGADSAAAPLRPAVRPPDPAMLARGDHASGFVRGDEAEPD